MSIWNGGLEPEDRQPAPERSQNVMGNPESDLIPTIKLLQQLIRELQERLLALERRVELKQNRFD